MKDVIEFLGEYLLQEFDTEVLGHADPGSGSHMEAFAKFYDLCTEAVCRRLADTPDLDEAGYKALEEKADLLFSRRLYLIKHYTHRSLGDLYAFYVSDNDPDLPERRLSQCIYIADLGEGLRVIALYTLCSRCHGTGRHEGRKCAECGGSGWRRWAGQDLAKPGKLQAARIIGPPPHADDREAWEALLTDVK